MISDIFMRDYRKMTAQGVVFTPEDIVRLNALAVRVSLSQRAADTVHLPRVAFLGKHVLREPTIAHELWLEEAGRWIDCRDDRNFLWLHGYALSRPAEKLADALKPKKVIRAVYRFAAKALCRFTAAQLTAAVEYALVGSDWKAGEGESRSVKYEAEGEGESRSVKSKSKSGFDVPCASLTGGTRSVASAKAEGRKDDPVRSSTSTSDFDSPTSPTIGLLVNAKALRLPITAEEAKRMTASELAEAVARARLYDREFDREAARDDALGAYVRAREEVKARRGGR